MGVRTVGVLAHEPVGVGASGVVLVRSTRVGARWGLTVAVADVDGSTDTEVLLSRDSPGRAAVAVNARGDVAVAFAEFDHRRSLSRVRLSVRRVGRAFAAPVTVASGRVAVPTGGSAYAGGAGVALALGRGGEILVAYQRESGRGRTFRRTIEARTGRMFGRLSVPQTLGRQQGFVQLAARVASNGRMAVAWRTQDVGEEANEPLRVHAALRSPKKRRFAAPQTLDPGGPPARAPGTVALTLAPDGAATVGWSSVRGSWRAGLAYPVRLAVATPSGRFRAPRELAPSGAVGAAVTDGSGATVVVWVEETQGDDGVGRSRVLAAARPVGATAFSAVEQISGPEAADEVRAAVDPRTGHVAAVWSGVVSEPSRFTTAPRALRWSVRR